MVKISFSILITTKNIVHIQCCKISQSFQNCWFRSFRFLDTLITSIRRKKLIFCLNSMNVKTEEFFTHLWHLTSNLIWQFVTFYSKEDFKKNFKDSLNTFFSFLQMTKVWFSWLYAETLMIIFIYNEKYFFEWQCEKWREFSATHILREIKFAINGSY